MTSPTAADREAVPLDHPIVRVLLVAFVAVHLLLAVGAPAPPWRTASALVLLSGAAVAVVLLPERRWSPARAAAVIAAALMGTGAIVEDLSPAGWPGYAAWPVGAATFVAVGLALRFRLRAAWCLMALLAAGCVAWSTLRGAGPAPGLGLVERQAGVLLIGTLFAVGLRRAARRTAQLGDLEREQSVARLATEAERRARGQEVGRVRALVEEPLALIAAGSALTADERAALLVLEARLRDEMSAGALLPVSLHDAAAAARGRGAQVLLLTDPALQDQPPDRRERAAAWLVQRLQEVDGGRVVGRAVVRFDGIRVSVSTGAGFEDHVVR